MRKATCTATVLLALCGALAGIIWFLFLPIPCRYSLMFWVMRRGCYDSDPLFVAWILPLIAVVTSFTALTVSSMGICDALNKKFEARKRKLWTKS